MEDGSHEFIVIQEGGVGVHVALVEILSDTIRSHKECIIDYLHKLSRMTINSTIENLNSDN